MREKKGNQKIALLLCLSLIAPVLVMSENAVHAETDYGLNNPVVETVGDHIWDTVYFGNYWQNDTNGDGKADQNDEKEPIRWRVLSIDEEEVFLLADQNLDCQPYNKADEAVTWEVCTLRSWLNEEFYENAFTEEEQSAIRTTDVVNENNPAYGSGGGSDTEDKVYLLSLNEITNPVYGFAEDYDYSEGRRANNTQYAKAQGASTDILTHGAWWLRSSGCNLYSAAYVYSYGYVSGFGTISWFKDIAVRPALRLTRSFYDKCEKEEKVTAHVKEPITHWDTVYFGSYWQNKNKNYEKEPIRWRVLSVNGDDAFLLADQALDFQPYNEEYANVTWETCSLRSWLNDEFYENAFSSEEQAAIQTTVIANEDNSYYGTEGGNATEDKIYLLSLDEVMNLSFGFPEDFYSTEIRKVTCTRYVDEHRRTSYNEWWLRSPGIESDSAALVTSDGYASYVGDYVDNFGHLVRPVLHLDLSSLRWSPAGRVSSVGDSEDIPVPTPTPSPSQEPTETPMQTPTQKVTASPMATQPQEATANPTATPTPKSTPKQNIEPTVKPGQNPPSQFPKLTAPIKVSGLKTKNNKKGRVTVSWKKVTTASGYELQYATSKKFRNPKTKMTKKTMVTIKNLKKKTYYFRVRAYKQSNGKKVYGKWSKVVKKKCK